MLKKNNSIGSAQVIIITAIVVALVGAVGYLGNAYQSKNGASTTPTTSETPKTTDTNTPSETANTQAETNVVKLDSWGVTFTPVESLASTQVRYYVRTTTDTPPQEYYGFSTARVEALGSNCTKLPFSDITILKRFAEKPIAVPDGELVSESPIGGYYYVVSGPIASCQAGSTVEDQDYSALKESLKTLEVIN